MAKKRLGRINDEIRDALSSSLRRIKDPRVNGGLISIIRCEATGDLRYCKVFVSVLGDEKTQKDVMKGLKSAAGWLRRELSQNLDLRYTPELIMELDNSIEHGATISKILQDIIPREDEETDSM